MQSHARASGGIHKAEVVFARAQHAVDEALRTVARSRVLAAALEADRDEDVLLVHCAWCGRYSLSSEWLDVRELPRFVGIGVKLQTRRVTDSICPQCASASR